MKKAILLLLGLFSLVLANAQVGVNTQSPKSTFHVVPMKTDGTTAEGIIAPNLSRAELIGKDARYGTDQRGAMVYVTAVDGTANAKVTKITQVGYYYFDGSVWQPFTSAAVTVPTEPWMVQGGTTQATGNAQNIYQTGSVHVGANTAVTAYKFQVTGASNITGNSRVVSSTVVGAQTVGGNHTVAGTSNLNGATNVTGTLNYQPGGTAPTANTYLRTDATGNASWQALPATATTEPWQVQGGTTAATTNAQNIYQTGSVHVGANTAVTAYKFQVTGASNVTGDSRVASSTVVGNQTVGGTSSLTGNVGVGAASGAQKLYVTSGGTAASPVAAVRIVDGNQASGRVLTSNANGVATWQIPGFSEFTQLPFQRVVFSIPPSINFRRVLSFNLPTYGTYSVTLGVRLRTSRDLNDEPVLQLLGKGADTDPGSMWDAKAPRFAGSYEILGSRRYLPVHGSHNREFRFTFSENITATADTGLVVYLVMYLNGSAGANTDVTVTMGNGAPGADSNGDGPQATGGSFVRIN